MLSNLTGATRGAGANTALFPVARDSGARTPSDRVEALVLSGSALLQLTSDDPGATTQQLAAQATDLPVFVHQADAPVIVPPAGLAGAPARGVRLSADVTDDVFALISLHGRARRRRRLQLRRRGGRAEELRRRCTRSASRTARPSGPISTRERARSNSTEAESAAAHLLRQRRHEAEAVPQASSKARHERRRRSPGSFRTSTSRTDRSGKGNPMAAAYKTPGVYIEEIPQVPAVRRAGRDRDPGLHRLHGEGRRRGGRRPAPQAEAHRVAGRVRAVLRRPAEGRRRSPSRSTRPRSAAPATESEGRRRRWRRRPARSTSCTTRCRCSSRTAAGPATSCRSVRYKARRRRLWCETELQRRARCRWRRSTSRP